MGAVGPYFATRMGDASAAPLPPDGFLPLTGLYAAPPDGPLGGRISAAAQRLRTPEPRVAASILHLGLAARLWSVALGAAALGHLVPDLDPARVHYRWPDTGPLELWLPATPVLTAAPLAEAVHRAVIEQNLTPLHTAIRAAVPISERLLQGNAASALAGALQVLHTRIAPTRPDAAATALHLTRTLLATPPLLGTGTLTTSFRRRSCCLYYRVPGGGTCGDCVFGAHPPSPRQLPRG